MEKFVLILSQIFMYVGFLVLLYIVYRVKNLKVQAPLDYNNIQTTSPSTTQQVVFSSKSPSIKYEYDIIMFTRESGEMTLMSHSDFIDLIKNTLNTKCDEGWELVDVDNDKYIFRKSKS